MARRWALPALLALALAGSAVGAAGCGEGAGTAAGATVHLYVAAPLCAQARGALKRAGGEAGEIQVRAICLQEPVQGNRVDLATAGANARRATEDSTAVAFLEAAGAAARFAQPIVEEAGIAWIKTSSASTVTDRVLEAIEDSGSGSLRDGVRKSLESS